MSQKDILIDLWRVMMKTFKDLKVGDIVYCIYWNEPEYTQIRINPEETHVLNIISLEDNGLEITLSNHKTFEVDSLFAEQACFAKGDFSFVSEPGIMFNLVKDTLRRTNQDLEDLQKYQKELTEFYNTLAK